MKLHFEPNLLTSTRRAANRSPCTPQYLGVAYLSDAEVCRRKKRRSVFRRR